MKIRSTTPLQITDRFGAQAAFASLRLPDGTEAAVPAEHAAAIYVNEQPAFRVVCTPALLPQLALGRLLTEGWIASADEVEQIAVCAEGAKVQVYLRHLLPTRRAAAQEVGAARLDSLRHCDGVRLALDAAGACHNGDGGTAADLDAVDIHDGIFRMELTVGLFIRLGHPHDSFHILVEQDLVDVDVGGIAHQTQDGIGLADAGVNDDALFLQPCDQALQLLGIRIVLEYDDHGKIPP